MHQDSHFKREKLDQYGSSPNDFYFSIDTSKEMKIVLAVPDKRKSIKHEVTELERNTMLKLIIGMAIDAYGYSPDKSRNEATGTNKGSIRAGLETRGIFVDDDTIRKYLNEAKELVLDSKPTNT